MNIYEYYFTAKCPVDSTIDFYRLSISSAHIIMVEDILEETKSIVEGYQEAIADNLYDRFGGMQILVGTHKRVTITTERGA